MRITFNCLFLYEMVRKVKSFMYKTISSYTMVGFTLARFYSSYTPDRLIHETVLYIRLYSMLLFLTQKISDNGMKQMYVE